MSPKIDVEILRNVAKTPTQIKITKNNRKVTATFFENDKLTLSGPEAMLPTIAQILNMEYPFTTPSRTRPFWYDRYKDDVTQFFSSDVAPHAATERITYTVPTDRKAFIESLSVEMIRLTAAAPHGRAATIVNYTPYGKTKGPIAYIELYNNTAGEYRSYSVGQSIIMKAGDNLQIQTADLGTGGAIAYHIGIKITEFEA